MFGPAARTASIAEKNLAIAARGSADSEPEPSVEETPVARDESESK
jgi:hypothetical protein